MGRATSGDHYYLSIAFKGSDDTRIMFRKEIDAGVLDALRHHSASIVDHTQTRLYAICKHFFDEVFCDLMENKVEEENTRKDILPYAVRQSYMVTPEGYCFEYRGKIIGPHTSLEDLTAAVFLYIGAKYG